jgi:uncharacterized protein YjiS (DUF1127 family)
MSAQTADSQFVFQLPSLSYIDAKWEEPNLRTPDVARSTVRQGGLAAWLSRQVSAFVAWNRESEAARELSSMSDRELMDIGLNRTDIGRVFSTGFNEDMHQRGV